MPMRIDGDLGRFKDIIRGKVKNNLKKYATSSDLIGQQGGKTVKIPLTSIDVPRFSFGGKGAGGSGMGDGEIGDPVGGPGKGKGRGKAGEGEEEHGYAEFSREELAQILKEHLELPNLENKGKGDVHSEKTKYNKIQRVGNESLRHFKRTYKEAIKRQISTGTYNPENPIIIPEKGDKRYRSYSVNEVPDVNAAVIYMMDVSGSMEEQQKRLVKSITFWIDLFLQESYKNIESIFITHDTGAKVVSREQFFKITTGGGTSISSAYKLCAKIIEEDYPFSQYNVYPFHFSDGDNFGSDNDVCKQILSDFILNNCNIFSYGQVKSAHGSGEFLDELLKKYGNDERITLAQVNGDDDVLPCIKTFFEKGK